MRQREGNESIYGGIVATPSRRQHLPRPCPYNQLHSSPTQLTLGIPRRQLPTHSEYCTFADLYQCSRPPVGGEGQFFYSHLQWQGVLKPSSAPFLGVIQDMYLDSTYKVGKGCSRKPSFRHRAFSETELPLLISAQTPKPR